MLKEPQDKIAWSLNTFYVEEENGEQLNDAIFKRNLAAMTKYNFTITETEVASNTHNTLNQNVLAGDDLYDAVQVRLGSAAAVIDTTVNAYDIPNVNLEKLYWDQGLLEGLSIGGFLPLLNGDILVSDNDSMMMTMYNRPLADDFKLANLYDVVREGKWTYDVMYDYMTKVNSDLDGNSEWDVNDRYGLLYADNAAAAPYFASVDTYLYRLDDGAPLFEAESERAHQIYETVQQMLSDTTLSYNWGLITENAAAKIAEMIGNKQVLFQNMVLSFVRRNFRDVELDFGLLPLPKLDEKQESYCTMINTSTPYLAVPKSVVDLDSCGFILEALAAESRNVTDVYYSVCMESKYTRDEESYEMIELASQNIIYDPGFVYNWGGLANSIRQGIMTSDTGYASLVASLKNASIAAMETFLETIDAE